MLMKRSSGDNSYDGVVFMFMLCFVTFKSFTAHVIVKYLSHSFQIYPCYGIFHFLKTTQPCFRTTVLHLMSWFLLCGPDTTSHVRWWSQGTKWSDETRYWENNGTIICKRLGKDSFLPFEQKMHCDKHCLSRNHPSPWLWWRNDREIILCGCDFCVYENIIFHSVVR